MCYPCALAVFSVSGFLLAQPAPESMKARALFYAGRSEKKEALPPVQKTTGKAAAAATAVHLGFRYNLVLINPQTRAAQVVDSGRNFRKGDCVSIDFESNRSGYLYVLARQSSGNWTPLFPSPQMENETNVINPGQKARVPAGYCFEINDPPGTEKLFVVLSRDPSDIRELDRGIRKHEQPQPQLAEARINSQVERLEQSGTRDLVIRRIDKPQEPREPAHSVYVVNASNNPASHVVAEIQIQHR